MKTGNRCNPNQDNKILIAKRSADDKIAKWESPGGKIEDGETAEQCLQREIRGLHFT